MANTLQIDSVVALTLALLERQTILGRLVHRDSQTSFRGGVGDTVRVRVPKRLDVKEFIKGTPITTTEINELGVPVKLTKRLYTAVELSDDDLTLSLADFGAQVLAPQSSGVASGVEQAVAATMNEATAASTVTISKAKPLAAVAKAAATFTTREVPTSGRVLVVGPELEEILLQMPEVMNTAAAGSPEVIKDGMLTRLYGFNVYVSPYITGAVAFTRDAFALAVVAPAPMVGAESETSAHNGYALRYTRAAKIDTLSSVSVVHAYVGATQLDVRQSIPMKVVA
ncbi:P22 phage major capsid protein family protein [Nonomuraea longicatena]|uniref:Major capsid protein n=1 Tax=Nonomuraea longicatena TaxID=83682 RepID=A0ABP4BA16_9ACTN